MLGVDAGPVMFEAEGVPGSLPNSTPGLQVLLALLPMRSTFLPTRLPTVGDSRLLRSRQAKSDLKPKRLPSW